MYRHSICLSFYICQYVPETLYMFMLLAYFAINHKSMTSLIKLRDLNLVGIMQPNLSELTLKSFGSI
jgi:hypothetical protein